MFPFTVRGGQRDRDGRAFADRERTRFGRVGWPRDVRPALRQPQGGEIFIDRVEKEQSPRQACRLQVYSRLVTLLLELAELFKSRAHGGRRENNNSALSQIIGGYWRHFFF